MYVDADVSLMTCNDDCFSPSDR